MKHPTLLVITLILVGFPVACCAQNNVHAPNSVHGNGQVIEQQRAVGNFTGIQLSGALQVNVQVGGATQSVHLRGESNILPEITTEIRRGALYLGTRNGVSLSPTTPVVATITVPRLEGITISGSGNARVQGVQSRAFDCSVSGSGNMIAHGTAQSVNILISGSGNVAVQQLIAQNVSIRISGSGSARLFAVRSVTGSISGSGQAIVNGQPIERRVTVSGSGNVHYN